MRIQTLAFILIASSLLIFFIYLMTKFFFWLLYGKEVIRKIVKKKIDKNIINIYFLRDDDKRNKPLYVERNFFNHIPGFSTSLKKEYYLKVDFMENGKIESLIARVDYNRVYKKIKVNIHNPKKQQ